MPPLVADRLDGRCAVVTGGGRGFGERIALELDALGATVAVLDVDEEAARRSAGCLARGLAVACDVGDEAWVRTAFAAVRRELGTVDILVNNAGIVNVSSLAGKRGGGFLGRAAHAAAKAGVIGFTKALARELSPAGVTVNAVVPGAMDTELTKALREDADLLARVLAAIPLGERGTIQDAADAVVFLCSESASYLTGETIDVDGGVMME